MLDRLEERERRREAATARARRALIVDMLKSYAGPLLVAAFINPILSREPTPLSVPNYVLLFVALVMVGFALILTEAKG